MHWLDKIYKDLDEKYKDELEHYELSTEELVKTLFFRAREHIQSDLMPEVLINFFGRFSAKITRLYKNILGLTKKLNDGKITDERRKIKLNELNKLIDTHNYKILNKHQWRYKHYNFKTVQLLESEGKLEIVTCKQDNHLFGGQETTQ